MGYLVLARKYRPQTFAEVSGQDHVVRTLSNALARGHLAHAFLFTGPRGVGKTTAARLVAKAVNCEKGPTADPCGRCTPCVEIAEGRSVDVVEIDAASNNGVDNIRDIVEAVRYRPARDRYKVFVVDEVHMLSTGAFNALLKTLEEPPEHVIFVLATTDVHKVPETIVSRCQRFDFRRLDLAQIAGQLRKVADAEGMKVSDGALALVARAAEGGMRDALSLLDRVRASCGDAPSDAEVAEAVGAIDPAAVSRIARAMLARDGAAILGEVQVLFDRGLEMKRVAEEVVRWLRDVTVAKLAPKVPLDLPEAERREVEAQAAAADQAQLGRLFDIAQRAVGEVKLAEQPRYALEVALLKGALLAPGVDVADLVARVEALAGGAAPAPRPPPRSASADPAPAPASREVASFGTPGCAAGVAPAAPAGPPAAADPGPAPPADRWRAAVDDLAGESPALAPALKQAALVSLGADEVRVRFAAGSSYPALVERRRGDVERAFSRFFGHPVRLAVEVGPATPAEPAAGAPIAAVERAEREAKSARLREAARAHPKIQEAARALGADIEGIDEL
ncbi:MAG TPA: DNA polymerase III subunit gamma/tau [Anaeromyxobacteraceae bacterium]|nr:DNA polymerase III subunit gamma/tau [Anaeromyxobacteraceae bacterium]